MQQGVLMAQVMSASYQRAHRQSMIDLEVKSRHLNRTLLIDKHHKDRLKMIVSEPDTELTAESR
jgi:hypothetical protein